MTQPTDTHITSTPGHHPDTHITASPGHGHDAGEHGHGHSAAALPFNDQEMDFFHKDDRAAASAIVLLVTGIFTIGIILYTIVDCFVVSAP